MIPYKLIDTATEHGTTLKLYQRDRDFAIRVDKVGELMNTSQHNSEEALARLACEHVTDIKSPRLLIGGLGLGYTLAEALLHTSPTATVVVSELMSSVVRWNREYLGIAAGFPLLDQRVEILEQDVGKVMRENEGGFHAIMLDVDNGPDGFTRDDNDSLYGLHGVNTAYDALKPGGVLTVWSAFDDEAFSQRMRKVGFRVKVEHVRARSAKRGSKHTIWVAVR
jgi:spermidine synthase